jgi:hypothetical protein
MKYRFLILLAVAGVLAACTKEESGTSESGVSGKVVAQFGAGLSDVKTTLGPLDGTKRKIFWAEGDCIAINGIVSNPLTEEAAGGVTALFDFTEYLSTPCDVLYPASMYKDEATITLPAIQTYQADGFKSDAYPMSARSESTTGATLSPLCALIKLPLKLAGGTSPDTDRISNIVFSGNDGEQVCGDFSINYDFALLTSASSAEEDKKVMININKSLGADPLPVVMVVPAGDYNSGFSIRVTDVGGHYMDMSKNTAFTVEAGHLYVMPEFEFVPTGTQLGIEISSADDLIAFAQNYNSKAIASEGLIATVMQDIVFDETTSEAFNATGGIGLKVAAGDDEDYYFNGLFNGNGKTISGLQATVPLFTATGGAGIVQDFAIDESCSFTFTHHNTAEADLGSVIGYHKGVLKDVAVSADVTITAGEEDIVQVTALGGLVGRVTEGLVQDCDYAGNITVPADYSVAAKLCHIGGLVGEITNSKGIIRDSDFNGTLETEAKVSSSDKNNPYLLVGGIVGSNLTGLVENCTVNDHPKEVTMANNKQYSGTLINHTTLAWHLAQGGIAGQNTGAVTDCVNNATVQNFVLTTGKDGTAADGNSRYYDYGGIVGLNRADGSVARCVNNGLLESRCSPRIQKIGGVVGYNLGSVESCSNAATGSIYITTTNISPYSVRVGEVGGVIGNNAGTISDLQNAAEIKLDRTENVAGVDLKFGGVIGLSTTAINGGEGKSISNSGNIFDLYNGVTVTTVGLRFGGVVGSAQASVDNVVNTGNVTVQLSSTNVMSKLYMGGIAGEIRSAASATVGGCENSGEVFFNVNGKNAAHTDNYAGGIIGKTIESNVAISDCTNSGYIHGGNPTKNNATTMFVGGIVAYLDGASSIMGCENAGQLLNDQFNNTNTKVGSTFEGGIAGFVLGTEENRILITDVRNTVVPVIKIINDEEVPCAGPRRGYGAGIAAYAEFVDIADAESSGNYMNSSGYWLGGIAGWVVNSTVSNATYNGTSMETSQIQGAGGIVCTLDAGSVLDGCYSHLLSIEHGANACVDGGIAAKSVAGSTIKNCHFTGNYPICSDENFTDGGGNVADID